MVIFETVVISCNRSARADMHPILVDGACRISIGVKQVIEWSFDQLFDWHDWVCPDVKLYNSLCLPACLPACLSVCLSVCPSVCLSVFPPAFIFISLYRIHFDMLKLTCAAAILWPSSWSS